MSADEFIATAELRKANVPLPTSATREELETFCLSIDGYEDGRRSIDDLMDLAERVEADGFGSATIDELRSAAFIRQRQLRATDNGDPEPPLLDSIRNLVAEIRQRVPD